MTVLDWLVIVFVLGGIVVYGLYKSRTAKTLDGYFLSNRSMPWYLILLSIMGTQASAITFLSGPGQAFSDGMRFIQYYFGLPLAMVVICITFVPIFSKLKVITAYEFLETRFNRKTRLFTSSLFLLQRGLSTGISIYAPALILSSLFGWDILLTNIILGGLLIIYTVRGGAKAVAYTQTLQIIIIFIAMGLAGYTIVHLLPSNMHLKDVFSVSGQSGKLNIITGTKAGEFSWTDKYNIWSGLIGGFFLSLSYFGTDQSQVGRYLTARSERESKLGLIMNGLVKVPMQFFILLIGLFVFCFYQFEKTPLSFNERAVRDVRNSQYYTSYEKLEKQNDSVHLLRKHLVTQLLNRDELPTVVMKDSLVALNGKIDSLRKQFKVLAKASSNAETNDTNYVFLGFVKNHLPSGLKGLLIAIIFLAAWGSIAASLNALSASTVCDFHHQQLRSEDELYKYRLSKWYTLGWGVFSIVAAQFSSHLGTSLIEAVNVLGSLFYGVILGIFLVALYMKKVKAGSVLIAAVVVEICILLIFLNRQFFHFAFLPNIEFLWLNAVGALGVMGLAGGIEGVRKRKSG